MTSSTSADDLWQRADRIFDAALDLAGEERRSYLDRACDGDAELRALVERLLASADEDGAEDDPLTPGGALEGQLWREAEAELAGDDDATPTGLRLGPYRILEEIGRGGMAVVYLAERADGQFEQRVAIKRIKRGVDTDEVIQRFDQERQILALAHHPHLAQLLDGGVGPDGRPYFVMEHVRGRPIDSWCDERRLTVQQRLRLFLQVAKAVGYAHRNLVVHRDLKPSNLLVTDEGVVKLLDFGIAKLLDSDAAPGVSPVTRTHARLMTPLYASPEQVRGETITTASDVYQLGLLLYQLLCGRYPYRPEGSSSAAIAGAICEDEPVRPSAAVGRPELRLPTGSAERGVEAGGSGAESPEAVAEARGTTPERLRRQLAGDLDNIVLKALRKEPERRYGSAGQLIEDLERYLDGRPVTARPSTFLYRAGKLLRRHRVAAVTAAAALVLILTLAVFYTVRLAQERDRARLAAAEATQVADFLRGLFEVSAPTRSLGERITARELLDRGAERIEEELAEQPRVQASMMTLMGDVYRQLAHFEEADALLERAAELRRRQAAGPEGDLELAATLHSLAAARAETGDPDAALELYREALELRRRHLGEGHPDVGRTLLGLGGVLATLGQLDEALDRRRRGVEILKAALGPEHPEVGRGLYLTGWVLEELSRYGEAREVLERALEILEAEHGADDPGRSHPDIVSARGLLGYSLSQLGEAEAAREQYGLALAAAERVYGPEHPEVADAQVRLADHLTRMGELEAAVPLYERALEVRTGAFGPDHTEVGVLLNNLGRLHQRRRNYETAGELYERALGVFRQSLGPDAPYTLVALYNLATIRHKQGELEGAYDLYARVLDGRTKVYGADHPYLNGPLFQMGILEMEMGRPEAAEPLLRRALAVGSHEGGARFPQIVRPRIHLGTCLTRLGRFDEAEEILMENVREGELDYGSARFTREALARLYEAWDRPTEAAEQWEIWRELERREMERRQAEGQDLRDGAERSAA